MLIDAVTNAACCCVDCLLLCISMPSVMSSTVGEEDRFKQPMDQAKMLIGSHDLPQKFLQIKQDGRFFSQAGDTAEESFRVLYYGGAAGAVPFTWESQPGTPKHRHFSDTSSLPPLTPPPSYQSSPKTKILQKQRSKPSFLFTIFRRSSTSKKNHVSLTALSSSSVSSSCSSGSYSSSSTPMSPFGHRRSCTLRSSRSTVCFGVDEDEEDEIGAGAGRSPTSTLCFGGHAR
ncbi:hypothetical protein U1Q18_022450 [Sarracenia purpurea var. burkii]